MQLRAELPRDDDVSSRWGRGETCGYSYAEALALTLASALFKAKSLSMFDRVPEQLYSPLSFDARQIPAYGFAGCRSTQVMILQGCYTITHHGRAQAPLQKLGSSIGSGPADIVATGKDGLQGRKSMSCCVLSSRAEGVAVAWDVAHAEAQEMLSSAAKGPCPWMSRAVSWKHLQRCARSVGQYSPIRGMAQEWAWGAPGSLLPLPLTHLPHHPGQVTLCLCC